MAEAKPKDASMPCVITIAGKTYDVTCFLPKHPAGAPCIQRYHGKDATKAFHAVHHSVRAQKMLAALEIAKHDLVSLTEGTEEEGEGTEGEGTEE